MTEFSLAKLSYNHGIGMVMYRSKMSHGKIRKFYCLFRLIPIFMPHSDGGHAHCMMLTPVFHKKRGETL